MLLRIDGKNDNPTQRLILALQERGSSLSKEEDFYLSLIDQDGVSPNRPSRGHRSSMLVHNNNALVWQYRKHADMVAGT